MNETPQQYTQRLLGYVEGKDSRLVLAETPATLQRLIAGVPADTLRMRPATDRWSIAEIVAHLADAEIVGAFRLRFILAAPGAAIVAYDQNQWAVSGHYEQRDPGQSVEQFRVVREGNLALLDLLQPAQWQHYGMHAERGRESIAHIVRMYAGHDINHLQQIEKILVRR